MADDFDVPDYIIGSAEARRHALPRSRQHHRKHNLSGGKKEPRK